MAKKKRLIKNDTKTNQQQQNNEETNIIYESSKIRTIKFTDKQLDFIKIGLDPKTKIFFTKGSAGTTKTYLSVYCALNLLFSKQIEKIIFVRTPVESAEHKMGFLPGDLNEKFNYYAMPFFDKLEEFLGKQAAINLRKTEKLQILPINFLRGIQWNDSAIIVDESQNFSTSELKTLLTRIGKNSKVFLCGDITQSDLRNDSKNDYNSLIDLFKKQENMVEMGINLFEFSDDDILRSDIVKFIVMVFKQLEKK